MFTYILTNQNIFFINFFYFFHNYYASKKDISLKFLEKCPYNAIFRILEQPILPRIMLYDTL